MFEAFRRHFPMDAASRWGEGGTTSPPVQGLRELFNAFGGKSFGHGLYRVIHPTDLGRWEERICLAFPEFRGRITCFGYDWLGRTFALDAKRKENHQPGVVMFEPGTGEALEIPANALTFHDQELIEFGDAALAISFYQKWRAAGGEAPSYDQCIGYRTPLFLGGADELENLQVSDLDVYWHITGQVIAKTRGLPPATTITLKNS